MKFSDYMFYKADANDFRLFSVEHNVALGIIFLLAILLVVFRKQFQELSHSARRKLEIGAGIVLLLPRVGLYLYYINYSTDFREMLPLYVCRLVIIAILYTLFTGRHNLLYFVYYFGIIFGVMPLFVVDTGGYTFPHATYFSFFVGHGMILLFNLYFILVYQQRFGKKEFHAAIRAVFFYFTLIAIVNPLVSGNYNYLEAAPPTIPLGDFDGTGLYKITLVGVYLVAMCLEYLPFLHLERLERNEVKPG